MPPFKLSSLDEIKEFIKKIIETKVRSVCLQNKEMNPVARVVDNLIGKQNITKSDLLKYWGHTMHIQGLV